MPDKLVTNPQEKPNPKIEAGNSFARWISERRKLTPEEISDIELEIQDLKRGYDPLKLKPRTEQGIAFAQWILDQETYTQWDLLDIEAQLQALKPPPPVVEAPKALPPGKLTPFLGSPFFVKQMEKLELGETSFSRWNQEKAKLSAKAAKDFEAEIKYVEGRIKELGWDDPEAIRKVKKELEPKKPPPPTPPIQPKVKPDLMIERIPYPKWWRDSLNAKIEFQAPGSQVLATVSGKLRLYVSVIVITVTGETVITFTFGNAGSSGPIYLGGTSQPMGMVVAMGNSPAPCGNGSLVISATDPLALTPLIGGWATCFAVEEKEMKEK